MPINNSTQPTNEQSQRAFQLFQKLNAELDAIGQDIQRLRAEIQKIIDKKQMYRILQGLNNGT